MPSKVTLPSALTVASVPKASVRATPSAVRATFIDREPLPLWPPLLVTLVC